MKKITAMLLLILLFTFSGSICYAGDVPEALLYTDSAKLYFGKVTGLTETSITILPLQKVKGEVELDEAVTYSHKIHGWNPQVGKTYLFGYIDENNLYFWVADSMDPKTLKLKDPNGMDLRLQEYLNNGDFEKAEEARVKKAPAPSVSPTVRPTPIPLNTPSFSPENTSSPAPVIAPSQIPVIVASLAPATTESSLPAIADMPEKSTSPQLFMIIALMAGTVLAVVVFILIIARRKRDGKNG